MKTVIRTIDLNRATMAELRLFISKAGKQANQRLRQLEQSKVTAGSDKYRYVKRAAFKDNTGMYGKTKKGEIKFNLKTRGLKISEMRKRAANIQKFIQPQINNKTGEPMADTSTVAGVKAKYKKAEETIRKTTGAKNLTIDDVAGLVERSMYQKMSEIYGPSKVMALYAKFKEQASGDTSMLAFERWLASKEWDFTDEGTAPSIDEIVATMDIDFKVDNVDVQPEDNPYMTVDNPEDLPL